MPTTNLRPSPRLSLRPHARGSRRLLSALVAASALVLSSLALAVPAQAAAVGTWADWGPLNGSSGARSGSLSIAETPALDATFASNAGSMDHGIRRVDVAQSGNADRREVRFQP